MMPALDLDGRDGGELRDPARHVLNPVNYADGGRLDGRLIGSAATPDSVHIENPAHRIAGTKRRRPLEEIRPASRSHGGQERKTAATIIVSGRGYGAMNPRPPSPAGTKKTPALAQKAGV